MATDAEILVSVRKLIGFLAIHYVTAFATGRLMLTRQSKTRLIVKSLIGIDLILQVHRLPTISRVTRLAADTLELFMKSRRMR